MANLFAELPEPLLSLFSGSGFMPHGFCMRWSPQLLTAKIAANSLVALAYFSIPIALYRFVRLQPRAGYRSVFVMFSIFIFACGATHVIAIINIWIPIYRLDAAVMALTAGVSVATAIMVWPLIPVAAARIDEAISTQEELSRKNELLVKAMDELERRRLDLEKSEKLFRLALGGAPIGLALVSTEGRFIETNQAFRQMLGYSEEELSTMNFEQVTHPDDLAEDKSRAEALLANRGDAYSLEKRYLTKDGQTLMAQLDVTLLRAPDGAPVHFISQVQDITRRKRTDLALRRSEERARLLSELDGYLQSCLSIGEAGPSIAKACVGLFPRSSGVVYLMNPSRTHLENFIQWGQPTCSQAPFSPHDCWSLRQGRPAYLLHTQTHATPCKHITLADAPVTSLCLPMTAQSEIIGVLYIETALDAAANVGQQAADVREEAEQDARLLGDRISVAVANLRLRDHLRDLSIRDPLTGLFNRRYFEESLTRDLARSERSGEPITLLMIDIDHFKRFNDVHGHLLGDSAIKLVAQELRRFCRRSDMPCRFGGEEFALVMPDLGELEGMQRAEELCRRIRQLSLPNRGGESLTVTVSVGLASYPLHGTQATELIDRADRALYSAKKHGRDRVVSA